MTRPPFAALALVSAAALGFEVALTRYFALAHYSEYGYWVISMAMAGFALSGAALSLWKDRILARREAWLGGLPLAALLALALGWYGCCLNPFNALELQHPALWVGQVLNIGLFYLALFPFFFCCGLYISICFAAFEGAAGRLYAFDLAGAALGSLGLLMAMFLLHPFALPLVLLPLPALAAAISGGPRIRWAALLGLAALEACLCLYNPARVSEYKPLSYAMQTEGARVVEAWSSPRGAYELVDDFTERLDAELSNNASLMGVSETPAALGLYVDGGRLSAIPKGPGSTAWFKADLESFPYTLKPKNALLIGTRGGFKLEAARGYCGRLTALENDPELFRRISTPGAVLRQPLELLSRQGGFDLIDISSDFAARDRFALSLDMLRAGMAGLSEDGMLSLGISVQELPAYGARLIATLQALVPSDRVLLYRSAFSVHALAFKKAPSTALKRGLLAFCEARSFDLSYPSSFPAARSVWNELPSLGWEGESADALRDEAQRAFSGKPMLAAADFDLRPATLDRPFFFSSLRLSRLDAAWEHIGELPREELGLLVNLAVLAQALLLGLAILAMPTLKRVRTPGFGRVALYFSCLGLGYLFYEVTLIEKITPYLQERAWAFSLVLFVMLLFSGLGSYLPRSMGFAFTVVALWSLGAWAFLDKALFLLWPWPLPAQALACAALIAPLAYALGMPFSLGLNALSGRGGSALPWAWSLNGAFSVIASPLAFLAGRSWGYSAVAAAAFLVYFLAWRSFPKAVTTA